MAGRRLRRPFVAKPKSAAGRWTSIASHYFAASNLKIRSLLVALNANRSAQGDQQCLTAATGATRQRVPVSRSINFGNGASLMARRCAAMCFRMAGCADRSPGLRSYRRALGFICIVPGDAARIARNRSTGRSGDLDCCMNYIFGLHGF
jgi:hypothetical protein